VAGCGADLATAVPCQGREVSTSPPATARAPFDNCLPATFSGTSSVPRVSGRLYAGGGGGGGADDGV
jgi:hypothetical protein